MKAYYLNQDSPTKSRENLKCLMLSMRQEVRSSTSVTHKSASINYNLIHLGTKSLRGEGAGEIAP